MFIGLLDFHWSSLFLSLLSFGSLDPRGTLSFLSFLLDLLPDGPSKHFTVGSKLATTRVHGKVSPPTFFLYAPRHTTDKRTDQSTDQDPKRRFTDTYVVF